MWLIFFEEHGDGFEQGTCARGGLFHDAAPDSFGTIDQDGGFGEIARSVFEERTEIAGDDAWFVFTALELVQEDVENLVERVGIERVTFALEVFAFAEQLAAKSEAVEMLLVGEFARGK